MINVEAPATRHSERRYAASFVLGDMLGLEHRLAFTDRPGWRISLEGQAGELALPDVLLALPDREWLKPASLPSLPLEATSDGLPVLFGVHGHGGIEPDIFGSVFFMLTRYEEKVSGAADANQRFPAAEALSVRAGLVDRAIVDEYVDLLWDSLSARWPRLARRRHRFELTLTHDVDWLTTVEQPLSRVARQVLGDGLRRRDLKLMGRRAAAAARARAGARDVRDPADTFGLIMDQSERHGLQSAFYFLVNLPGAEPYHHEAYTLSEPRVLELIARIAGRGHEVGLHGAYGSHRDGDSIGRQLAALREAAAGVGVEQEAWGGRHHFLQFEAPATWRAWDEAGMTYDSTVGFAEAPGFRCGTTHDFPVFDLDRRRPLALVERSLTAMEGSFLDPQYLGLDGDSAAGRMLDLARVCRRHGGRFTLLWHNTALVRDSQRALYNDLLETIARL